MEYAKHIVQQSLLSDTWRLSYYSNVKDCFFYVFAHGNNYTFEMLQEHLI